MPFASREGRTGGLVRTGTKTTASPRAPAWIRVLERVGIAAHHKSPQRGVAREGAEAARGIRRADPCDPADQRAAQPLQHPLAGREPFKRGDPAVANCERGAAGKNRRNERRDIPGRILVIGIGVDDQIRAHRERFFQPGGERPGQAAVGWKRKDLGARAPGGDRGAIRAAVVDDEHFDCAHSADAAGQRPQRDGEGLFFVVGGDLDDEFHKMGPTPPGRSVLTSYPLSPLASSLGTSPSLLPLTGKEGRGEMAGLSPLPRSGEGQGRGQCIFLLFNSISRAWKKYLPLPAVLS